MNKGSIELIDHFVIDAIKYIKKKSIKRVDKPTIIDYVFNVDKQVVEKRITFVTTNGTLENKQNCNKTFFRVKDQAKLASDDIINNTPAITKIFNAKTEAQVTDLLEESVTEDSNCNNTS